MALDMSLSAGSQRPAELACRLAGVDLDHCGQGLVARLFMRPNRSAPQQLGSGVPPRSGGVIV
jgi:hypothetical protein